MGYIADKSRWMKVFDDHRRLFDLPINLYLNYWYGIASLQAMQTMMDALQSKGIYYFQTGNAFAHGYDPNYFAIDTSEVFLEALSKHRGLVFIRLTRRCRLWLQSCLNSISGLNR